MVYPGPWQESRVHEELFTLKDALDTGRTIELLGETPTARSGWDADHLAALGWSVSGSSGAAFEQAIDDPPPPDPDLSLNAFKSAFSTNVGAGAGAAMQFDLQQSGDQLFLTPPPRWEQDQQWEASGTGYRLWFDPTLQGNPLNGSYALPPGATDTDDYYYELENTGADRLELVEVTVLASSGDETSLYVKDAHPTEAVPFLRSAVAQGGPSSSINQARAFDAADTDLALDHVTLNDLAENGTPAVGGDWSRDGRMPTMSILYDGLDRREATVAGEGFSATYDGNPVRIRIRYRWPRWRKVYYEPQVVAIQQTTNRDDHLAGGAYQTWPAPSSRQLSNITFGGYL